MTTRKTAATSIRDSDHHNSRYNPRAAEADCDPLWQAGRGLPAPHDEPLYREALRRWAQADVLFRYDRMRGLAQRPAHAGPLIVPDGDETGRRGDHRAAARHKALRSPADGNALRAAYGTDALRLFLLSDSPPDRPHAPGDDALDGAHRYLNRVWRLCGDVQAAPVAAQHAPPALRVEAENALAKVTRALDESRFHCATAALRQLGNAIEAAFKTTGRSAESDNILRLFLLQLGLFTPSLGEMTWRRMGFDGIAADQPWPQDADGFSTRDESTGNVAA